MRNAKRLAAGLIAGLLGTTPLAALAQAPVMEGPAVAPAAPAELLLGRAQAEGRLRVIVELREEQPPADEELMSPQQVQAQRGRLRTRQESLLARLGLGLPSAAATGGGRDAENVGAVLLETMPYLALNADAAMLRRLLADPQVASVQEDVPIPPALAQSVPLIGASQATALGFHGGGWVVAVLDSGVAKSHPAFIGKVVSEACYSTTIPGRTRSLCPRGVSSSTFTSSALNCPASIFSCDHGTHAASVAVGNAPGVRGVARGARLIAMQIFSLFVNPADCGQASAPCLRSFTSDLMRGLERVYALRTSFKIASVNLSLSGGGTPSSCDAGNPVKPVIDRLRSAQIATVIASGNEGFNGGVGSPGCISTAVTVGSTTKLDQLSPFSNHGALVDLLAPGSDILAAVPGGVGVKSGTSFAAPHVAGAFAVLRQAKPTASVSEIQAALVCTGRPIARAGITKRRIDVLRALQVLRSPAPGCA